MTHFTEKTIAFLMENHFHNNRNWFQAHRDDFLAYVMEPLQAFVAALAPTMLDIDDKLITEPKVDRTISRVYRDTRFSRDKSLYRDHMWCVFMRDKKLYHGPPAFFFELSPDWFQYGCGYYQASPKEMDAMRALVLEGHPAFLSAKKACEAQPHFRMEGDCYKRNRHPEAPEALHTWLNRKSIAFIHRRTDFPALYSEDLAAAVSRELLQLKPIYAFFMEAHGRMPRD